MRGQRVLGKISSFSSSSGELFGRPGWEFGVVLQPWRMQGEAPNDAPLRIGVYGLERAEADSMMAMFETGTTIAASVSNLAENNSAKWSAIVTQFEGEVEDDAIANFVPSEQLLFAHPQLGEFTRDRRIGWYEGYAQWLGKAIRLTLDCQLEDAEVAAANALALLERQQPCHSECVNRAYADLHPTWRQSWADVGEELSKESWQARLTVTDLTVAPDGTFSIWFSDGDLFLGHAIKVSGNIDKGAISAELMG
ncbi:DUF2262 domain-containing protein [Alteriqipengyuania sp. 357]